MTHSINNHRPHLHWCEGPLAEWLDPFAVWLDAKGYAVQTVQYKIRLAGCFSRWLQRQSIAAGDITPDYLSQYLECRWQRLRTNHSDRHSLVQLTRFLQQQGEISCDPASAGPITESDRCVQSYERCLLHMRGLAPATIMKHLYVLRGFLQYWFASGPVTLSSLCAEDVVGLVRHKAAVMSPKNAKYMTYVLRSFLRYSSHLGDTSSDLVGAVPTVANWSMPNIPRGIEADQTDRLLASIDRSCAIGRRNYAILIVLARLGLRAMEVRLLELDDIDWVNATLRPKIKGARRGLYPLSQQVGEAIADYIQHGRPKCASRRLFLCSKAPVGGFSTSGSICSIVRRLIIRAGVDAPTGGAHQFRHGLASDLLSSGASLAQIGDVLGHCHPDTTRIYAKVDLDALRSLALPWPGGAQ